MIRAKTLIKVQSEKFKDLSEEFRVKRRGIMGR